MIGIYEHGKGLLPAHGYKLPGNKFQLQNIIILVIHLQNPYAKKLVRRVFFNI